MLEVRLLGQFDVRRDGTPVVIPSRAAQSLCAYLVLTAGTAHRREQLAGLLWPDTTEENARKNLRHELWRLRKAIETKTPRKSIATYLAVDEISIGFNAESDYWLDVSPVQRKLGKQLSADDLIETLSLYRGELLPGWYDEWVVLEREQVHAVFEQKMARLLELLIEEQRWHDTLEWGERWIALGQTPEPAYRSSMVAHGAMGNMSQVASVYERCVRALRDDLGVEPSEQTRALFERLSRSEKPPDVMQSSVERKPQSSASGETRHEPRAATAFPARPRAGHLPVPLTSFIGREHEIHQVKHILSTTRLLTLIGSGGVGKTRLAIQLASDLSSEYKDGAWWVDLVSLSDPALVPQAVAKALGVREDPNVPLIETLADTLCSKQIVLVLDNCEHLVSASAQLADSLLGSCASLKILATSREALGISGETIWRVPSLSLPKAQPPPRIEELSQYESARLFIERARAANPDFTPIEQNALPIAEICQRLDGIPLAIELAAARVKTLSVQQIAVRLDDRFGLLTGGSRTALPRHQTLRATIDWSYELLSEPECILFRRLSVFVGGWTLEAAESVCGGGSFERERVLDLSSRLVDKSLVIAEVQDGAARYRMLETIRRYSYEKLTESGEANTVDLRHLEFFLRLAEESEPKQFGADQATLFNRLDTEIGNLRAAVERSMQDRPDENKRDGIDWTQAGLRLVGALAWFFENRYRREASELLKQILASKRAQQRTAARAKALNAAGLQQWGLNNFDVARPLLEEALSIGRELGDKLNTAWALVFLGMVADAVGNYRSAQSFLEEGLTFAREFGELGRFITGFALAFLGDAPLSLGNDRRAEQLYEQSIVILREIHEKNYLAYPLRRLGYVALRRGNYAMAVGLFKESFALNQGVGHATGPVACLAALAATFQALGEHTRAATLFGAVAALLSAVKLPLLSPDRSEHDRYLSAAREQLEPVAFEAAWSEGSAMSLEEAISYALSAVEELQKPVKPAPNNLPVQLSSFVGRRREIGETKHLLAETRLLTLTGSGGVGKTRLALKVATELLSGFKDGVWWTDLVGLMDEQLVPQAVAGAVGLREVPNQPVATTLVNYLRSKQLLLVLDNCEHLVEACAQVAALLLSGCPNLRILTTSREALAITGEITWRVPSLSLPDPQHLPPVEKLAEYEGVRLFVERARAVNVDFTLTEQNALPLVQICRRLDGIPLAIELASARVKSLSVHQIAARLDDRFNLLARGSRTALPRHQTLRATIDWSHELLSEPEKQLFRRLAVFAGGWTLEAAESVCAGDSLEHAQVFEVLARLVDKSLVISEEQGGAARYRLLETIRQYADEKLEDAGHADAVRRRHLEFFVKLAEESEPKQYGAGQSLVLDRLELEIDNLRAAIEWALENEQVISVLRLVSAIPRFWFVRAHHNEGLERLREILALPDAMQPSPARLKALNAYSLMLWPSGRLSEIQPLIEEALALGIKFKDRPNTASALRWLGVSNTSRGEYALARSQLDQSLEMYRKLGDWTYSVWGLVYLGEVELLQGNNARAQDLYEQAIPRLEESKDYPFLAIPQRRLGQLAMLQDDPVGAGTLIKASLTSNWSVHDYRGVAASLAALGALSMVQEQMERATKLLGVADAILEFIRTPMLPFDQQHYERNVAALRSQLDEAAFAAAWADGHAMSLEQAIAFAMEDKTTTQPSVS